METIDRKFKILAVNPATGKSYTDQEGVFFCAKDRALPAALRAYSTECIRLGANPEHVASIGLLLERVKRYQAEVEAKVPDTLGPELDRCIHGVGV